MDKCGFGEESAAYRNALLSLRCDVCGMENQWRVCENRAISQLPSPIARVQKEQHTLENVVSPRTFVSRMLLFGPL